MASVADPSELLRLAWETAHEAAALIGRMRSEGVSVAGTKTSAVDVVTEADRASEELIRDRVGRARPDDSVVGEEGEDLAGSSGVRWIVDPIDGTVNYLYGSPQHCVSIAVEVEREVVAGVVVQPGGSAYAAARGAGATRDGRPIRVRSVVPLEQRLVATGFAYDAALRAEQGKSVAAMLPRVRDIRRGGSCALDLCGVAEGLLDAYVEEGPHVWDHAAGGLIAREAGAHFALLSSPRRNDVVVCAPEAGFAEFRELLSDSGFVLP